MMAQDDLLVQRFKAKHVGVVAKGPYYVHEDEDVRGELPAVAEMLSMERRAAPRSDVVEHLQPHGGDQVPAAGRPISLLRPASPDAV